MNFQSLNLNLNRDEMEKDFFKSFGQRVETGTWPSDTVLSRPA
jgi:hypothetical protein